MSVALNPKCYMKLGNGSALTQKFLFDLVCFAKGSEVDTTIVDGRVLTENRKLMTIDADRVFEKCSEITERLGMKQGDRLASATIRRKETSCPVDKEFFNQ